MSFDPSKEYHLKSAVNTHTFIQNLYYVLKAKGTQGRKLFSTNGKVSKRGAWIFLY